MHSLFQALHIAKDNLIARREDALSHGPGNDGTGQTMAPNLRAPFGDIPTIASLCSVALPRVRKYSKQGTEKGGAAEMKPYCIGHKESENGI